MSIQTGYQEDTDGIWIPKDTEAKLTYTLDWSQWLPTGATVSSVSYSHNSRVNDADPIIIHSSGVSAGTKTYAVISGGTKNRVYNITAAITLDSGQTDRRAFRIKVQDRIAE
jgi:hypothetical protein